MNAFLASNSKFKTCLAIIGGVFLLRKAFFLSMILYKNFIRKPYNLSLRYGSSCYVLIYGSANSLGKAFAEAFAKRGFNIIFFIPGKKTLEMREFVDNLSKKHNTQAKIIGPEDVYDLENELKSLDIGVFVNLKAKEDKVSEFLSISEEDLAKFLVKDIQNPLILTRFLLKKFQTRTNKSAIINVSSFAAEVPLKNFSIYSAKHSFLDMFSQCLAKEFPFIDILSLKPLLITNNNKKNYGLSAICPEKCVDGCLRDLGHEKESYGHYTHKFQAKRLKSMPERKKEEYYQKCLNKLLTSSNR